MLASAAAVLAALEASATSLTAALLASVASDMKAEASLKSPEATADEAKA